jgi:hypothetical protein
LNGTDSIKRVLSFFLGILELPGRFGTMRRGTLKLASGGTVNCARGLIPVHHGY